MLLSFRVVNHRSLRDLQHLNLAPVYEADRPGGTSWPAVPVAAIYGANASGKSNLVDAFRYMQEMVLSSDRDAEPGLGVRRTPFRLDPEHSGATSSFAADVLIDGTHYAYGFTVDDDRVVEEWLHRYPKKRRQLVFAREVGDFRYGSTIGGDLKDAEGITAENALFLSVAARAGKGEVQPFYRWMRSVAMAETRTSFFADRRRSLNLTREIALASRSAARRGLLLAVLRAADLGIEDFEVRDDAEGRSPSVRFRMNGAHGTSHLDLSDQSEGTRIFLTRMFPLLDVLEQGSVIFVDELEANLHPGLTGLIVRLFQNPLANPRGAQLIFTTHNTALLGSNAETLKRDQVWFVEKDYASGASRLFPLTDFKPRDTENTERRYRGGSYRAVPFVDEEATVEALAGFFRQTAESTGTDA